MHTNLFKNCVLVSLVGLPAAAHAAPDNDQRGWNLSIIGGYSGGLTGSLTSAAQNAILDLSALDPTLAGAGSASLDRIRYADAFRPGESGGIEAGYGLTDHVSIYTRLTVARYLGRGLDLGAFSGNDLVNSQPLAARFHDQEDIALQVGSRYSWAVGDRWRPFIGGGVGITRPDKIRASLTSTDSSFTPRDVDFTDSRRVFGASVMGGADLAVGKGFGLRFSVGADYAGAPRGTLDPTLGALGVNVDHDAGAKVDYPLEVDAVFKLH